MMNGRRTGTSNLLKFQMDKRSKWTNAHSGQNGQMFILEKMDNCSFQIKWKTVHSRQNEQMSILDNCT